MRPPPSSFHWFTAQVENTDDPLMAGRLQIRIHGIHGKLLGVEDLPWAWCIAPTWSASMGGIGISNTGPMVGTWVCGFFSDGQLRQNPLVWGTIQTANPDDFTPDIPLEATGEALNVGNMPDKFHGRVGPKYPFNQVIHTEAGHVVEFDNTEGAQRIAITHKEGHTIQFLKDGSIVIATAKDIDETCQTRTTDIKQDRTESIGNNLAQEIGNDASVKTGNNRSEEIGSNRMAKIGGNDEETVGGNVAQKVSGNKNIDCPQTTNKGNLTVIGNIIVQGTIAATGMISAASGAVVLASGGAATSGSVTAAGDVQGAGVSLSGHTHQYNPGPGSPTPTSPPS